MRAKDRRPHGRRQEAAQDAGTEWTCKNNTKRKDNHHMITDIEKDNIPAQEQEAATTEKVSDNNTETEINDTVKIAEDGKDIAVSEKQNEKEEETNAPEQEPEDVSEARARALAQIEKLSMENGFSGPWASLFREYPFLSRSDAKRDLEEAVKAGKTPLEAYQQKLLAEKDIELEALRSSSTATGRSTGAIAESNDKEQELDDFLIGFYSV